MLKLIITVTFSQAGMYV